LWLKLATRPKRSCKPPKKRLRGKLSQPSALWSRKSIALPMELSKQSCDKNLKAKTGHLVAFCTLLVLLTTWSVVALTQQDHEAVSSPQAGQSEHHEESPLAIVWKWGNFLILFGGLSWYLRKPLRAFLDSRSKAIEEGLASGRKAKEEAFQKLSEIEARLAG